MHNPLSRRRLLAAASALALGAGGFALSTGNVAQAADHEVMHAEAPAAVAVLTPTAGNEASGTIRFTPMDGGLQVEGRIEGLTPGSKHGFHVHEYGDVSAEDGTACGGHFNPEGHDHALPDGEGPRHAGDLGNVTADDAGVAEVDVYAEGLCLGGSGPGHDVLGRGLIVHADEDDGGQPTGNAGARIAQAVIGVAAPAGG